MDPALRRAAREAIGFMPENEGLALYEAALDAAEIGPLLEIGSYCGKSAIYLGAAAVRRGTVLYSIDHHRGSEEHQPGEEYHDPRLIHPATARVDTLPVFLATVEAAGLRDVVVPIVARSGDVAAWWHRPLGLVFIDGGHSDGAASADYRGWSRHVAPGGSLLIHDVFPDPAQGGRAPFNVYKEAVESQSFVVARAEGSLRVLQRVGDGWGHRGEAREGLRAEEAGRGGSPRERVLREHDRG